MIALVIEDGGSEDEAIAALLHDAAGDRGGQDSLDEIGCRFRPEVERIVSACSDTFVEPRQGPQTRDRSFWDLRNEGAVVDGFGDVDQVA